MSENKFFICLGNWCYMKFMLDNPTCSKSSLDFMLDLCSLINLLERLGLEA